MTGPPDGGPPSVGEPREAPQPQADLVEDADVHAFLIADVRGWTAFTQERGDEEAGRLAARFAEVARSVVASHRGNVLELRGDEAMVVFGSPRSAIRGAVALQQRFVEETIADPSLPLTVGIGLDAGEAVPVEGGYRGRALNVAARLCSLARAGEVLASREIVHLAARVDGVRFTERGPAELKGLDRSVHVVVVRSEDRDDTQAIAPFVRSTAPPPRKRWKAVAAAVAFAVIAALAIPLVTRDAAGSSEIRPNSVGVLDSESGEVTATVGLDHRPGSVAMSEGAVWVTNPDTGTVTRIDPEEQEVRDSIPVGENPTGIAVGFDAVWVVESGGPSVSRISPDTNTVVGDPITVGNGPAAVAVGEGSVWVTNRFDGTISRIDPDAGGVVEEVPVGLDPRGIAIGFGDAWVALSGSNTVVRIDPTSNKQTGVVHVGNSPGAIAVSADAVWVVNSLDDTLSRIDPETTSVVGTIPVGDGPTGIDVVDGVVWVANGSDGTLSRIDPGGIADQPTVRTVAVGSIPQGINGANGGVWVSVGGAAIAHRGGTLKMVSLGSLKSLDPNLVGGNEWLVWHLIGDGLVAFEPIGGTNPVLVPDLATATPEPAEGGRTYTFELRRDIRYSTGEVVAPSDFLRAFERGFLVDTSFADYFGGIVGSAACEKEPDACDLSGGIATDDVSRTITFSLVAPDPDFLFKLTLPTAYPVPPSVPKGMHKNTGIPGTGPYMLEAPMTRKGLALVRNRHFRVWSQAAQPDGFVDRIEWSFGVEPEAQIEAVTLRDADYAVDASLADGLEEILIRYPAQVHTFAAAATSFLVLNTEVPPFDNVDVRRAMNLAADRNRAAEILGGGALSPLPTCQTIPPNFPGYEPYCPYTLDPGPGGEGSWTAPDLLEAQRLVDRSGTKGMRVVLDYDREDEALMGPGLGDYGDFIIELLDDLGYRGSVRPVAPEVIRRPGREFQLVPTGWGNIYPAASDFIASLHRCGATFHPIRSGFCDPRIDEMIDRAVELQLRDPAAAGVLWAEIDRAVVDQAPYLWLVNPSALTFVSERVGNYQQNSVWGVQLNQLWLK